jgi:hypothetical protein
MTEIPPDSPCIVLERSYTKPKRFTVVQYDEGTRRARSIGTMRGLAFHGLNWTHGAPAVEELSIDWIDGGDGRFRICDPDAYDLQMRKLLGIL